ncbi:Acylphosphatase [archaeon HR01]|nr:Acylphosphatase [archaeon HR01]
MKALKIKVYGRVQRVGFRRYVHELGQELELAGYVKNEKDGSVTAFIQGEEEQIEKFLQQIKSTPPPAKILRIEAEDVKPKPSLKYFQIVYGKLADELQEGFGAMQSIFMDYWGEFRDYRKEFKDYREEFRDFREEFRDYRGDFRDYRKEFKDYREEFRDFREEFREFVKRMDEFAERVTKVLELLVVESGKSRELLEIVARDSRETREMLVETMKMLKEVAGKVV